MGQKDQTRGEVEGDRTPPTPCGITCIFSDLMKKGLTSQPLVKHPLPFRVFFFLRHSKDPHRSGVHMSSPPVSKGKSSSWLNPLPSIVASIAASLRAVVNR